MFNCTPIATLLERFRMTRRGSSSCSSKTTINNSPSAMSTTTKSKSAPPSPRNSSNRLWVHEQQRRIFLHHLKQWSLNHDSSLHFHGKISLSPPGTQDLELGKPVTCVLTDTAFTDARQKIVIKLFLPQEHPKKIDSWEERDTRRDSMDPFESDTTHIRNEEEESQQGTMGEAVGHYKLVVRCGAGWMSAREYFNKLYISRLDLRKGSQDGRLVVDECLASRSQALGPPPSNKDSITISPLFHPFCRLPTELREMILKTAAGLTRSYNLCSDEHGLQKARSKTSRSAISLGTMFRISKKMTEHLNPYMYHSTDFHFGLVGFTNFLWQTGPTNRQEVRRLTFHFGRPAALHCLRWLAPDPIFALFEPPVATSPRSLQYFWRCQIQDLVKELHLFTVTLDIKSISKTDIPMIVAILKRAFGSVRRIVFVETDRTGVSKTLQLDDTRLECLHVERTWRELCLAYYHNHRNYYFYFKDELTKSHPEAWEELQKLMDQDKGFYDTKFLPMSSSDDFAAWK